MLGFFWYLDSGIVIVLDKKIFIFFLTQPLNQTRVRRDLKEVFVLAW